MDSEKDVGSLGEVKEVRDGVDGGFGLTWHRINLR